MSARDFLRRQLTDDERLKLGALPTNDALDLLLGGRQPLNSSLTALSDKTIGARGLDLLASSTSAAAINALGGSAGLIVSGMITSLDAVKLTGTVDLARLPTIPNAKISDLDASKLTGVIDVARLPVIPGNNSISATTIAGLTTLQQATVSLGTMVYTADGGAWRYSGSGSKTAEASYYYTADVTPEWNAIANKPALATAAQGALADTALQPGASAEVLTEGATKKLLTATERTKLAGIATGATANATDASLRDRATHTGSQEMPTITGLAAALFAKFDKAGGVITGLLQNEGDAPFITAFSTTGNYAGFRALNASGRWDFGIDNEGRWGLFNYGPGGAYESNPLIFGNDGTPFFNQRPYFGAFNDAGRLITYGEAVGLVGGGGGGGGTITSVFGRSGPLIDAANGDYNSSQITHGTGSVSDALTAKSDNFDTLDGGAI
jgi:hypothetical protein